MDQLMIFTETNIYILSKLVALVRRDTGVRHRLNSHGAIIALLKDASRAKNQRIRNYYLRFLENLTAEQLIMFQHQGLSVPKEYRRKPGLIPSPITRQYAYLPRQ